MRSEHRPTEDEFEAFTSWRRLTSGGVASSGKSSSGRTDETGAQHTETHGRPRPQRLVKRAISGCAREQK